MGYHCLFKRAAWTLTLPAACAEGSDQSSGCKPLPCRQRALRDEKGVFLPPVNASACNGMDQVGIVHRRERRERRGRREFRKNPISSDWLRDEVLRNILDSGLDAMQFPFSGARTAPRRDFKNSYLCALRGGFFFPAERLRKRKTSRRQERLQLRHYPYYYPLYGVLPLLPPNSSGAAAETLRQIPCGGSRDHLGLGSKFSERHHGIGPLSAERSLTRQSVRVMLGGLDERRVRVRKVLDPHCRFPFRQGWFQRPLSRVPTW